MGWIMLWEDYALKVIIIDNYFLFRGLSGLCFERSLSELSRTTLRCWVHDLGPPIHCVRVPFGIGFTVYSLALDSWFGAPIH